VIRIGSIHAKDVVAHGGGPRLRRVVKAFRAKEWLSCPVHADLVEHPDDHILIDTGMPH
jgi:hypothetical protein